LNSLYVRVWKQGIYYSSEKHNHIVLACLREHKTKEITPCLLTREPNAIETFVRMIL
jgi:hypothetical protein